MGTRNRNSKPCFANVNSLPFYEPPPRKTSTEIINEARAAIKESSTIDNAFTLTAIKPLQTQRPFTPRDKERILFGKKVKSNRPPSSFSLRYLQTEADLNVLPTTPENNLSSNEVSNNLQSSKKELKTKRSNSVTEINNKVFDLGVKELNVYKIKLPALDGTKPLQTRKLYKSTYSLDNLPEEYEIATQQSDIETRNAFSSPQERTDFNSPFGRPSKQQNLSQCLLLGPQNLNKLFENKQIVEDSESLFIKTGYFNKYINNNNNMKSSKWDSLDNTENYKMHTVEDVIELLNIESSKFNQELVIINLLNELYDCMEKEHMLNSKVSSKMKIHILKCLYKFVESQNEKLLLNVARIILALKVTGNNLSGVCKLIFKVSKNDKNDKLFLEKNVFELFVDALGRSSPLDDTEACIYGYGAIKFLTMNSVLLEKIKNFGILHLMVLHIKLINNAKTEKTQISDQTNHALFQLTGALRNLASDESMYDNFISSEAIIQLCQTMTLFSCDIDIISNISRTLSTISTNDNCCDVIAEYKGINKLFVQFFMKYPGNEEIIIRLAYTLGNVVAKLDKSRIKFYEEKNSIDSLIKLWKIYIEKTLNHFSLNIDSADKENTGVEDVMIKIIRVIANLAINPEIGKSMNDKYGIVLIDEFLKVLISNPFKKNNELVLSILSTLNNLSYYYTADFDKDIFHIKQIDIMEAISEYINSKNKESVIETIRILGNLSRSKITRNYITKSENIVILTRMLDSEDIILLKTTAGVFVNLMTDSKNRLLLKEISGVSKLINILNNYGQCDWSLSMLICQVIWNFCIDAINLYDLISDIEVQQLLAILADYLDEERIFGMTDSTENINIYAVEEYLVWEEFANVATNLLEKIEHFLDTLEQLQFQTCSGEEVTDKPKTKDSSTNISFATW